MQPILIYPAGCTPACLAAARELNDRGIAVTDHITPEATHLLMDVPSFSAEGVLRSGADFSQLMARFPEGITLIGGRIPEAVSANHPAIDLLKDDTYQFENAAITAECALRTAAERISFTFRKCAVLIVGWGRIGKHLAFLLKAHGARVTILSRSPHHRAEACSFGMQAVSPAVLANRIQGFRIIFNTAPSVMIPRELACQNESCLKIDLASLPGIEGEDVIRAGGLPGIHTPESAGQLMADTILRLIGEDT